MKRTNGARKRSRFVTDDEIRALMATAKTAGTFGAMVQVLLLTAQHREKITTMQWEDIVDGEWRIASADREKSNAGSLRLPPVVLKIIAAQPKIKNNPYVFAATFGRGAFNSHSQRKDEIDKKLRLAEPWVIHDLRRTARSLMARAGVRPDIAERVLGTPWLASRASTIVTITALRRPMPWSSLGRWSSGSSTRRAGSAASGLRRAE
jgi:integrase